MKVILPLRCLSTKDICRRILLFFLVRGTPKHKKVVSILPGDGGTSVSVSGLTTSAAVEGKCLTTRLGCGAAKSLRTSFKVLQCQCLTEFLERMGSFTARLEVMNCPLKPALQTSMLLLIDLEHPYIPYMDIIFAIELSDNNCLLGGFARTLTLAKTRQILGF